MSLPACVRPPGRRVTVLAVARRDLLEFIRDRRTLFITLVMPMAMYPVLALASLLGVRATAFDIESRRRQEPLSLVISGGGGGGFARLLQEAISTEPSPRDADWPVDVVVAFEPRTEAERMLEAGDVDFWIDIPADSVAALEGRGTVAVAARVSTAHPAGRRARAELAAVLRVVNASASQRRILRAGLPVSVLEPQRLEFAGPAQPVDSSAIHGIVPTVGGGVLVLLALLTGTGAFYPAIDAIAGEKERGTIETLLIAPAPAGDIVLGKFLAILAITLVTLAVNAVSIGLTAAVLLRFVPAGMTLGVSAGQLAGCIAATLVTFVGLAAVAAALCLAVTAAARSTKEAQNTLTPVIMLVSALAGAALLPGVGGIGTAALPFTGQVAIARMLLEPPTDTGAAATAAAPIVARIVVSLAAAATITWLLLRGAAATITDEQLLFRGPDAATGPLSRPASRCRPTLWQALATVLVAVAALWYAQGLAPENLVVAVPLQQLALLGPLVAAAAWQRVDLRETFALRLPSRTSAATAGLLIGAAGIGFGLFITGAAALLAVRGTSVSTEALRLAERLVDLVTDGPAPLVWLLVAVLPAVCEEAFFRGWLFSGLVGDRPSPGRAAAAVFGQAALFAVFHLLPERMPQTFVLGIAVGWLTLATRSIVPAVVAHAVHNATPLALIAAVDAGWAADAVRGRGLPVWVVVLGVGCLLGGGLLVAGCMTRMESRLPWRDDVA